MKKAIHILGGGLAGLSLGIALRARKAPVTIVEAGTYPRHKVCGEFITGVSEETLATLGIANVFKEAMRPETIRWYSKNGKLLRADRLPSPAWAISRYNLDAALAQRYEDMGGKLVTGKREKVLAPPCEGVVHAHGRIPQKNSPYLGLKQHFQNFDLNDGLEIHLGENAYVGLCRVDGCTVNVCGLFLKKSEVKAVSPDEILQAYLLANGMVSLHARLSAAQPVKNSLCSVAALSFEFRKPDKNLHIGDQMGMIAPFTGNGMSIAFESALAAVEPLTRFSKGECDWDSAVASIQNEQRLFRSRLRLASTIHPFLLQPLRGQLLQTMARTPVFPFKLFYQLLH